MHNLLEMNPLVLHLKLTSSLALTIYLSVSWTDQILQGYLLFPDLTGLFYLEQPMGPLLGYKEMLNSWIIVSQLCKEIASRDTKDRALY